MSDETVARIEAFLSKRSDAGAVTVHDYVPITGGYSRAMSRFYASDANGRRGYVMRADPPPGQSILDTIRDGAVGQHPSIRSNDSHACEGACAEISYDCLQLGGRRQRP